MDELSDTLRALADPSRRRQLSRLTAGEATSGELATLLPMSRPAGSQHLAVLVAANLVRTTARGRQRWHELQPDRLYAARAWLDELIDNWESTGSTELVAADCPAGDGVASTRASTVRHYVERHDRDRPRAAGRPR